MITQAIVRGILKIDVDPAGARQRAAWLPTVRAKTPGADEKAARPSTKSVTRK
jgi:hypothetical protein